MNTLTQQQINQYQWQVADGVARIVNPHVGYVFPEEDKGYIFEQNQLFEKFDEFAKQHQFHTNAPDGIYSGEAFEEQVWQIMDIDEEHAKWDDISQHDMKCYGFDYQKLVSEYEFKDTVHTRPYLRLKSSHLPAVLTTQPGEEWKDRYREVWYFYDFDLLKWKDLKPRLQNDVIFEEAINMYRKVKREWHLITPPAEQEAGTVKNIQPMRSRKGLEIDLGLANIRNEQNERLLRAADGFIEQLQSTLTQKDQRIAELERGSSLLKADYDRLKQQLILRDDEIDS